MKVFRRNSNWMHIRPHTQRHAILTVLNKTHHQQHPTKRKEKKNNNIESKRSCWAYSQPSSPCSETTSVFDEGTNLKDSRVPRGHSRMLEFVGQLFSTIPWRKPDLQSVESGRNMKGKKTTVKFWNMSPALKKMEHVCLDCQLCKLFTPIHKLSSVCSCLSISSSRALALYTLSTVSLMHVYEFVSQEIPLKKSWKYTVSHHNYDESHQWYCWIEMNPPPLFFSKTCLIFLSFPQWIIQVTLYI